MKKSIFLLCVICLAAVFGAAHILQSSVDPEVELRYIHNYEQFFKEKDITQQEEKMLKAVLPLPEIVEEKKEFRQQFEMLFGSEALAPAHAPVPTEAFESVENLQRALSENASSYTGVSDDLFSTYFGEEHLHSQEIAAAIQALLTAEEERMQNMPKASRQSWLPVPAAHAQSALSFNSYKQAADTISLFYYSSQGINGSEERASRLVSGYNGLAEVLLALPAVIEKDPNISAADGYALAASLSVQLHDIFEQSCFQHLFLNLSTLAKLQPFMQAQEEFGAEPILAAMAGIENIMSGISHEDKLFIAVRMRNLGQMLTGFGSSMTQEQKERYTQRLVSLMNAYPSAPSGTLFVSDMWSVFTPSIYYGFGVSAAAEVSDAISMEDAARIFDEQMDIANRAIKNVGLANNFRSNIHNYKMLILFDQIGFLFEKNGGVIDASLQELIDEMEFLYNQKIRSGDANFLPSITFFLSMVESEFGFWNPARLRALDIAKENDFFRYLFERAGVRVASE